MADIQKTLPLKKYDPEKRLVYGVVYAPDDPPDTQGDVASADEIEKMAHNYLRQSRVIGKNHSEQIDAEVVESYIAPADFTIGDEQVKKGSWVLVGKIHSDEMWNEVKEGKYEGWSLGGTGERHPID